MFSVLDKTVEVKPDPLALLSLEKEGIDVSFLKAFDPSQEIKEDISVDQIMEQLRRVFKLMRLAKYPIDFQTQSDTLIG